MRENELIEPTPLGTATTVVTPPPTNSVVKPRSVSTLRQSDVLALLGAGFSALSLTALIYVFLAPFTGPVGFVLLTYLIFLGLYALLISFDESGPAVRDRLAAAVVHTLAAVLFGTLVVIIAFTAYRGIRALVHLNFYSQDLTNAGPLDPLTVGGISHGIVGTLIEISIALAIVIPLGIACAVYLNEFPGALARFVRTVAEAMTALPSIIAGLFIYATLILIFGLPKSGFAAALAISVMMLPIIIRAADVVLRLVPGTLKEASLALGTSRWRTAWHVILPTSRSGLMTAVILGAARGIGETSPVLVTAGYTASMNTNPFSGPMVSMPLVTFNLVQNPQQTSIQRAFGAAVALLIVVLVLFVIARILGGRGPGNLTSRQMTRRSRQSARVAVRMASRAKGTSLSETPQTATTADSTNEGSTS